MRNPALILLFTLFTQFLYAKPILYNGIAATVGKTVVTVRDAYLFRSLQRFKEGESPAVLIETGEDLKHTVQKLIFEEMVFTEMKSFQFEAGPRSMAEKIISEKKAGKVSEWKNLLSQFGVTENVAIDRLYKSMQVEKFLQKKTDTLTPIITDSETERYFKQNQSRFKGSEYGQIKPNITLLLKKQRMQKGLEEWVRFLRDKYGVANLLDS